ncbi:hypothetical protein BDY24DRAFT_375417 [Mrakia frigida]|uniref:uncharacterized protein n=1 Tax=Mrakia frigida TaxID=29902 RepID=UPI003FCBF89D
MGHLIPPPSPSPLNRPCFPYPAEDEHDPIPCLTPQPKPPKLPSNPSDMALLLHTLNFAANKHSFQRRKDPSCSPYINHPIGVSNFIANSGETDVVVLQAAILHDVLEDTDCSFQELQLAFGSEVADVVMECTDDCTLGGLERKRRQVATAAGKTARAQQVKLADKLHNVLSIQSAVPTGWTVQRVQAYFRWAKEVTDICKASNPTIAASLQDIYDYGTFVLDGMTYKCLPKEEANGSSKI